MAYFEKTNIADEKENTINPSTEEAVILLRRMVKLMEQQAATDTAQRQRVTIDAITAGVSLPTVAAVTAITNALPAGTNAIGAITTVQQLAGYDQRLYTDWARAAYNTGIRQNLIFS